MKPFFLILLGLNVALRVSAGITPGEINAGLRLNDDWLAASHDARWAAFATSRGFGLIDTQTGRKIGGQEDWRLYTSAWSPTQDVLALLSCAQGKEALHLWNADTGGERELLSLPDRLSLTALVWSPDGATLYAVLDLALPESKALAKDDNPPTQSKNVTLSLTASFGRPAVSPPFTGAPGAYAERTRSLVVGVDIASGSVHLVCEGNDIDSLYPSPDGKWLALEQTKTAPHGDDKGTRWTRQAHSDVYVLPLPARGSLPSVDLESFDDRTAGWYDAAHQLLTPALRDLLLDSSVGEDGHRGDGVLSWSPDSSRFAWATTGRESTGDVFVYDLATRGAVNLTQATTLAPGTKGLGYGDNYTFRYKSPKFGGVFAPLWLPDGRALVAVGQGDAWFIPLDPRKPARDLTLQLQEETRRILPDFARNAAAVDASGRLIILSKDKTSRADTVWKLDPRKGLLSRVCATGQWIGQHATADAAASRLVYMGCADALDLNVFAMALTSPAASGANLTGFKPELAKALFPERRILAWKTSEGAPAYGVLYLPPGASPAHKVPAVIEAYPGWAVSRVDECKSAGPRALRQETLDYLDEGLAVLYPDIPMSDLGVYDHPARQILDGVNAAADAAISSGAIDGGHLGILGVGYGGYMAQVIVTHTDRFKAAVSAAGVADWFSDYLGLGTTGPNYEEIGEARLGVPVWDDPVRYVENSPFSDIGHLHTPILYIHQENDPVTPKQYDFRNFDALNYIKEPYVIYSHVRLGVHDLPTEERIRAHLWFREHLLGAKALARRAPIPSFFFEGDQAGATEEVSPALPPDNIAIKIKTPSEIKARALLDEAKAKLLALDGLSADFESNRDPAKPFDKTGEIALARPDKFRVLAIGGTFSDERRFVAGCDGAALTRIDRLDFIGYRQPVYDQNVLPSQNFLVQFFFDQRSIDFHPQDPVWDRPVSIYDTNAAAYDRDLVLTYVGRHTLDGIACDVAEIKYNNYRNDIRVQVYVGPDKYIYQVDTYLDGAVYSQKYRNYRANPEFPEGAFAAANPERVPLVATDPIRLGKAAPDFDLPGFSGGRVVLRDLLKGKSALLVCALDVAAARGKDDPDLFLKEMRILQRLAAHFKNQGVGVVCILGGPKLTPGLIEDMKLDWLPDVSRFDYPIAIDMVGLGGSPGRSLQRGATFENFHIGGRGSILLDAEGKVLFASKDFDTNVLDQLAFHQALGQLGISVSDSDFDEAFR